MKLELHCGDEITGKILKDAFDHLEYDLDVHEDAGLLAPYISCALSAGRVHRVDLSFPIRIGHVLDHIRKIERNIFLSYPEKIQIGHGVFFPHDMIFGVSGEKDIPLTEKESSLLLKLWSAQDDDYKVSRDELLKDIWGYQADLETHTLETHIYRLRQKIERDPAHPLILLTIEDGYKLVM